MVISLKLMWTNLIAEDKRINIARALLELMSVVADEFKEDSEQSAKKNQHSHYPLRCIPKSRDESECALQPMHESWLRVDRIALVEKWSFDPLISLLVNAGCPEIRAVVGVHYEGYGMLSAPAVISACEALRESKKTKLDDKIGFCDQCGPGTNTFVHDSSRFEGGCTRVKGCLEKPPIHIEDKVLCIGAEGSMRYCGSGEFMAVSHVWSHGWQGVSEDGICSRVLDML